MGRHGRRGRGTRSGGGRRNLAVLWRRVMAARRMAQLQVRGDELCVFWCAWEVSRI